MWFERIYQGDEIYLYKFSDQFRGQKNLWRDSTKKNSLFLSTAVQLNSKQLIDVFNYIANDIVVIENGAAPFFQETVNHISIHKSSEVQELLVAADISIADIQLKKQQSTRAGFKVDAEKGTIEATPNEKVELLLPVFEHRTALGSATFELADESEGTVRLFSFAGPIFDIITNGKVLVVDELDRSFHTLLVRQLVNLFQSPEYNKKNAQLVFTTHDTSLLQGELLRRDQIWFVEKEEDQSSSLYPLTDFSPRRQEAIEKGYLAGRYGGVPVLRKPKL
jgi:AAA15 family ATPase/GTPase